MKLKRSVALGAALLTFALPAAAERYALVIGIKKYPNYPKDSPQLQWTDSDAEHFATFLQSKEGGFFKQPNVVLMPNEKATNKNIRAEIRKLGKLARKPDDIVYVYFAGHGAKDKDDPDRAYLMASDAEPEDPGDRGLPADEFLRDLRTQISAGHLIVFIDACYAGAAADGGRADERSLSPELSKAWKEAFRGIEDSHFAFLSSSSGEKSWETEKLGNGAGVFTYYLLEGLRGQADIEGDRNGIVTASELFGFLYKHVTEYTREHFRLQTPMPAGNFNGSEPLAILAGATGTASVMQVATPVPGWKGPVFPLLPDPPADAWPSDSKGEDARRLALNAKGLMERLDLDCANAPSFGHSSPSQVHPSLAGLHFVKGAPVNLSPSRNETNVWARAAFDAADQSVEIQDNPWARMYRGLALARLRAFRSAQVDLDRAVNDFRDRGLEGFAQTAGHVRVLTGQWEAVPALSKPPAPARRPGCGPLSGRTVCELASRADWSALTSVDKRTLVDRSVSLLKTEHCLSGDDCIPIAPATESTCARLLAAEAEPPVAAEIHRAALEHALRNGLRVEAAAQAEGLFLALLKSGNVPAANDIAREQLGLFSHYRRAWLGLRAALEPSLSRQQATAILRILGISPDLTADLLVLQSERVQTSALLNRIETSFRSYAREHAVIQRVLDSALQEGRATEGAADETPSVTARDVVRMLDYSRMSIGGEVYDRLPFSVDRFRAALRRVAENPDAPTELGAIQANLPGSLSAISATLKKVQADDNGDREKLAFVSFAVSAFSAYDASLRGDTDWQWTLMALLEGGPPSEVSAYNEVWGVASLVLRNLLPQEERGVLMQSILVQNLAPGGDEVDAAGAALKKMLACLRMKQDEPVLQCVQENLWRFLEQPTDTRETGIFTPVVKAHRLAKTDLLKRLGGKPVDHESWALYQQFLFAHLSKLYKDAAPGELTDPQRDFLIVILSGLTVFAEADRPSQPAPSAVDLDPALELQQLEVDRPGASSELLTILRIAMNTRHEPASAIAIRARKALSDLRQPFYRAFLLAMPATYIGLTADEIHSLVALSGVQTSSDSSGLLEIALSIALALDFEDDSPKLTYTQSSALASFVLGNAQPRELYLEVPLSLRFAPFADGVVSLTSPTSNCEGSQFTMSFEISENAGVEIGLTGLLSYSCFSTSDTVSTLLLKALHEKLWADVKQRLTWLEQNDTGNIGDAAAAVLHYGRTAPKELRSDAVRYVTAGLDRPNLELAHRLSWTSGLALEFSRAPAGEHLVDHSDLLRRLDSLGRQLANDPTDAGKLDIADWFQYVDDLSTAVQRRKDAHLESLWRRQTTAVRGLLVAFEAPRPASAGDLATEETPIGQAFAKLEKDAAGGDAKAMTHLGWIRMNAIGSGYDKARAHSLFEKAANLGDREAMQHLAVLQSGSRPDTALGALAVKWLERSHSLGNPEALTALGRLYLEGHGVQRDLASALKYFHLAADAGSAEAMNEIGIAYAMGTGVTRDFGAAASWFRQAAELGHSGAESNLLAVLSKVPLAQAQSEPASRPREPHLGSACSAARLAQSSKPCPPAS